MAEQFPINETVGILNMSTETIGFVGAGLMGHGMAKNILAGGYPVTVIANRNRTPVENLVGLGAQEATSLPDLAKASSIVFICAPGSPQVEQIVTDMIPHLKAGSIIVDCSTSDPVSTEALSQKLIKAGHFMADAPLGGTPFQAEEGALTAMVGATEDVFNRIEPVIKCWAGPIVHLGGVGDGHKMKLLNNFLSLGYAAIYSEALALAVKSGLTPQTFDTVIRGSRMDCGFYQTFMGHLIEGNRESHKFTLTNAFKDMRYLESMADNVGLANPVGNAVKNSLATAVAGGGGGAEDYVPHLPEYIGRANGVEVKPVK
jgi:3-hydroxyisobutyrate dehydrogenase-like beta-hydroxyacid dehydrogenase